MTVKVPYQEQMEESLAEKSNEIIPRSKTNPVLIVEQLQVNVSKGSYSQPLVQEVTFTLHRGETLALVGESGSGKSVTASALAGLLPKALHVASLSVSGLSRQLYTIYPNRKPI